MLATLMLLTYTNLIGLIIDSLRYTNVYTFTSQDTALQAHRVWQYQPTLQYVKGRHLALGIISIAVALLYIFPMTAFILFGDILRRNCIHSLWFSHLDVFHGAYTCPFGFWLGLRMLIRVLFVLPLITIFQLCNSILLGLFLAFYFAQHFLIRPFHKRTSYSVCIQKSGWKAKLTSMISHFSQPKISDGNFLIAFGSVIGNSE